VNSIYSKQIIKGKRIVLSLVIVTNIYYWIDFFLSLDVNHIQILLKQILAIGIIVTTSLLFYKGFKIAEWFTLVFLIKPILANVFYPLYIIGILELYGGWLMLILTIFIGVIGAMFIGNEKSISEFLRCQSKKRKWFNKN